jgi:S1-C subfamily serine protease/CHAT domain-containing protein
MQSSPDIFVLNISREGDKLRITAFEKTYAEEQTLKHYEENPIVIAEVDALTKELLKTLNRANRRGDINGEILDDLKRTGQGLFDELLTTKVKGMLRATKAETLILYIDDHLVQIPWELLFDGSEFLSLRFNMGRIVSTRQTISLHKQREESPRLSLLVLADPQGNLENAYNEGILIRDTLPEEKFRVDLKTSSVDGRYLKQHIRDYDLVHYAGHAYFDEKNPSQGGWVLSDGKWTSAEITKLTASGAMPFLVFSNACHSGRTSEWSETEIYGLANAFLLSGVTHYVGTFWEILDAPSSLFAAVFYESLGNGASVGEALRDARKRVFEEYNGNNIIWASYMLYGDPSSQLVVKDTAAGIEQGAITGVGGIDKSAFQEDKMRFSQGLRSDDGSSVGKRKRSKAPIYVIAALLLVALLVLGIFFGKKTKTPQQPATSAVQTAAVPAAETLEVKMNIIGQREEPDRSVSEVLIREGGILQSQDNFQVHVNTNKDAHVYLIIFDSMGQAQLLFPDPKIGMGNMFKAGIDYTIPSEGKWFWLDENVGTETIYVLASLAPLEDISALLKKMESIGTKEKAQASNELKQKIRSLERGVGGISEGKAETFRLKDGKAIQNITNIVQGTGAVVRAVSFRHIDNRPFKNPMIGKTKGKEIAKLDTTLSSLDPLLQQVSRSVPIALQNRDAIKSEIGATEKRLKNLQRAVVLEDTRGIGGVRVYKEVSPAVVLVVAGNDIGSGTVIDAQGHVLTNWHVVENGQNIIVFFKPTAGSTLKKENAYAAQVLKADPETDLALLKIKSPPPKLAIAKLGLIKTVEVGQEVHAIGHPEGETWTYTKGIISQIRDTYEWSYDKNLKHRSKVIQTQTPINPGNSGGPLINDNGEVIGVNSFTKRGEGLNFAVAIDVIRKFLTTKEVKKAPRQPSSDTLKNAKYIEYDTNKDGVTDILGIDSNGNGKVDIYAVDLNQDGVIDYMGIDENENGKIEIKIYDTDKDGIFETYVFDLNEDGKIELYGLDVDGDGEIDKYEKP